MSDDPIRDLEAQLIAAAQRQATRQRRPWPTRSVLVAAAVALLVIVPSVAALTGVWTVLRGSSHSAAFPSEPGVSTTSQSPSPDLVAVLDSLRRAQTNQDRSYVAQQAVKLQGALLRFSGGGSVELSGVRRLRIPGSRLQFFLIPVRPPARHPGEDFVDIQAVDASGHPPIGVAGLPPPPLPNGATAQIVDHGQAFALEGSRSSGPRPPRRPSSAVVWLVPSGVARVGVSYPRRSPGGGSYPAARSLSIGANDNLVIFEVDRTADDAAPLNYTWYGRDGHVIRREGDGG